MTCDLGTLAAGSSDTVLIQVKTDPGLDDPTTITNTASVSSPTAPTTPEASAETTVHQSQFGEVDLRIEKTADPDPTVIAGETLTYQLVVTNDGPAGATDVKVVDSLPVGTSFVTATVTPSGSGACTSGVFCALGFMAKDETVTITIVVNVDSDQTEGLTNVAFVSSVNPDTNPSNNSDEALTDVDLDNDLIIQKTAKSQSAVPGASLEYEIVITNDGPSIAPTVILEDTFPANWSYLSHSTSQGSCNLIGSPPVRIRCTDLGPLQAGETHKITLSLVGTVDSDATGEVVNVASVTCLPTEPQDCANNDSIVQTPISAEVDLRIQKDVSSDLVTAGETFSYTITVENLGPSQAQSVSVSDTLPPEVEYVDSSINPVSEPDPYVWDLGTINNGETREIEVIVRALSTVPDGRVFINTASVTSSTEDTNPGNNSDDAQTQVFGDYEVVVEKSASTLTPKAGETLVYTINVHNNGPSTAKNVEIKDLLPDGLKYVNATGPEGVFCSGNPAIVCQVGDMPADSDVVITIETIIDADVPDGTEICNTAIKHPEEPSHEGDTDEVCVTVVTEADVSVLKSADPQAVGAGQGLVYTILVHNNGPSESVNVVINDVLPAGLNFVNASTDKGTCSGETTITCNLGDMPVGSDATITVETTVDSGVSNGTTICNTATKTSDTTDPQNGNNSSQVCVEVGTEADVSVNKLASADPVKAGEGLNYTIQVHNNGPSTSKNVQINDVLPGGLIFSKVTPSQGSCFGTTNINCTLGDMPAGSNATITIETDVDSGVADGTTICNTATKSSDTSDPQSGNDFKQVCVDVEAEADLRVTKSDSKDPVKSGEQFEYTITVVNDGPSDAVNVSVSDTLPAGLQFISANPSQASGPIHLLGVTALSNPVKQRQSKLLLKLEILHLARLLMWLLSIAPPKTQNLVTIVTKKQPLSAKLKPISQ